MPVTFQILPDRGLVYVRYQGPARLDETMEAFGRYMQHPDARPWQKHLVDLSAVTDIERDYAKLMAVQARKADQFLPGKSEVLMVYYAPTRIAREIAHMVLKSWETFDAVVARVQSSERDALSLLGLPETRFSDLLERAGPAVGDT